MLVDVSLIALAEIHAVVRFSGVKVVAHMFEPSGTSLFRNSIKSVNAYLDYLDKLKNFSVWAQAFCHYCNPKILLELDPKLFDAIVIHAVPRDFGELAYLKALANSISDIMGKPAYMGLTLSSIHLVDLAPPSRTVLSPLILAGDKFVRVPVEQKRDGIYVKVSLEEYARLRPERPIVEVRNLSDLETLRLTVEPPTVNLAVDIGCEYVEYCLAECPEARVEGSDLVIPLKLCPRCAILAKLCDKAKIFNDVEVL